MSILTNFEILVTCILIKNFDKKLLFSWINFNRFQCWFIFWTKLLILKPYYFKNWHKFWRKWLVWPKNVTYQNILKIIFLNSILGLLSEEKVEKLGTPLDTISNHLANVLSYEPDERDMILMRHEVSLSQLSVESWEDFEFSNS